MFDDAFVDHTPQPGTTPDKDGGNGTSLYHRLREAFPDFDADIKWQSASAELVTTYKIYRGRPNGTFLGVTPTGQPVEFETVDVMRVVDGKIVERWGVGNLLKVMTQLGCHHPLSIRSCLYRLGVMRHIRGTHFGRSHVGKRLGEGVEVDVSEMVHDVPTDGGRDGSAMPAANASSPRV